MPDITGSSPVFTWRTTVNGARKRLYVHYTNPEPGKPSFKDQEVTRNLSVNDYGALKVKRFQWTLKFVVVLYQLMFV